MLFSSIAFIFLFLPIVLGAFLVLVRYQRTDAAKLWLIAASLIFYGTFIPVHLSLSTVVNFILGRRLLVSASRTVLTCGLVFNLAILASFKYADFLVQNVNA